MWRSRSEGIGLAEKTFYSIKPFDPQIFEEGLLKPMRAFAATALNRFSHTWKPLAQHMLPYENGKKNPAAKGPEREEVHNDTEYPREALACPKNGETGGG